MIRTLTGTPETRLLAAMRRQMEESRLSTVYGCFGVRTAAELFERVREARAVAERVREHSIVTIFDGLRDAAQNSGLKIARSLGERLRETRTLGGAVPSHSEMMREAERINSSPVHRICRELKEICEQANRENEEAERRESVTEIIRHHRKEMAAQFAAPLGFAAEPVRLEPITLTMEINVFIIPKNQSTEDGGNPPANN